MTDREKAIVTAYTGITMLTGEKFSIFHKYIEDLLGRPVWTHELATEAVWNEIKEKSKPDFLKLCAEPDEEVNEYACPYCGDMTYTATDYVPRFCQECGRDMGFREAENER